MIEISRVTRIIHSSFDAADSQLDGKLFFYDQKKRNGQ